jgi:hypothetical protein
LTIPLIYNTLRIEGLAETAKNYGRYQPEVFLTVAIKGENMDKETEKKHGIMDTPLPLLLDDLEAAAASARQAAEDARTAGEKAAEDVMKRLRKIFLKMSKDITEELDENKK